MHRSFNNEKNSSLWQLAEFRNELLICKQAQAHLPTGLKEQCLLHDLSADQAGLWDRSVMVWPFQQGTLWRPGIFNADCFSFQCMHWRWVNTYWQQCEDLASLSCFFLLSLSLALFLPRLSLNFQKRCWFVIHCSFASLETAVLSCRVSDSEPWRLWACRGRENDEHL